MLLFWFSSDNFIIFKLLLKFYYNRSSSAKVLAANLSDRKETSQANWRQIKKCIYIIYIYMYVQNESASGSNFGNMLQVKTISKSCQCQAKHTHTSSWRTGRMSNEKTQRKGHNGIIQAHTHSYTHKTVTKIKFSLRSQADRKKTRKNNDK